MKNLDKAVIFDLDGTLWDSSKEVVKAWNIVLERHPQLDRKITLEDMHSYMGKNIHQIFELMLPDTSEEERLRLMEESCKEEHSYLAKHGGKLYDSVVEILDKLKKDYKLMIVSNCQDGYAQTFLEYTKLWDYFCDFEVHGRTGLSKGENIKLVMERNGIKEAVYVGDTMGDKEAAKVARVPFIYAEYGFGQVDDAKYIAKSFRDVEEIVGEIFINLLHYK